MRPNALVSRSGNCQNTSMKRFLLRRLGLADDPGHYRPNLQSCLEAVLEQSSLVMDDVLAGLRLALIPVDARSGPPLKNASAFETVELLLANAMQVKQTFSVELRRTVFGGDAQRSVEQPLVRFDDFQFLDSEQIDANIELALTQQEVQRAVEDVLPMLNAMVSNLLGWSSVQAHLNPLKPESFVHALRQTFVQHIPDDAARGAVMTLAAGKMGMSLRLLYRETSDWLRSQGVEAVHTPPPIGGGLGGKAATVETSMSRTMLTLDKLRRLLSGELNSEPAGEAAPAIGDFSHTVPASFDALQDMKLLESMMNRLAERASKAQNTQKKVSTGSDLLAVDGSQNPGKRLGGQLGEEVVRLMLDNLMQDKRLLSPVRASLKAMEPVLIKLSESDARFFSERQHPARLFMERITHRSLAYSAEDEPGFARFQKSLDNSVNVLSGGSGDAAAFARVLRKLEEGWAREEHGQRLRAEDAARELLHAEQRNLLAARLANEYTERLLKLEVPDMVVGFLRGPWAQVVAEAQLKFADGRVDPGGYQSLVDDLIWSVQLKLARRNRSRLVQMVPGMLVKMRQGLQLISYPAERMTVFFDELITFHEKAFEGPKLVSGDALAESAPLSAQEEPTDVSSPDEVPVIDDLWMADSETVNSGFLDDKADISLDSKQAALDESLRQEVWDVDKLNTGSWVDLALGGVWVRAQLTWASPHRTLFMFISGSGLAHSMSRRTLERLKTTGLIRLVSDGHVMDNALDGVARAALQNDLRGNSTKNGEVPPV